MGTQKSTLSTKENLLLLEDCGLGFVEVEPAEYEVGSSVDLGVSLLANPPQIFWSNEPRATPSRTVRLVEPLYISRDVLRLDDWLRLVSHPDLLGLEELVPERKLQALEAQRCGDETVKVHPTPSAQQKAGRRLELEEIARQPEPNPALALDPWTADRVTSAVGGTLPRWYEWEIAARGRQGRLYPWGDEIDLREICALPHV